MTIRRPARAALVGLLTAAALVVAVGALLVSLRAPRSDLDWAVDHAVPARVDGLDGGPVTIRDMRDFRHREGGAFEEGYRDLTFHPDDVRRVWFVLAPFADRWRGLAHTFLSFELTGDRYVSVSVEARREAEEGYSLMRGVLRGFEVTYVVGTEEDLVGLRALRGDSLYMYPARADARRSRELFLDVLRRAEAVRISPEFYNTFLNNCTTNLRDHVNRIASDPLPWGWGMVFPGYSDGLALEHGLLDVDEPIDEARRRFRVDAAAREALRAAAPDFSVRMRAGLPPPLSSEDAARGR